MTGGSTRAGGVKAATGRQKDSGNGATSGVRKPHDWGSLQHALGNQGTQRLIEKEQSKYARRQAEGEGITPVSSETQRGIDAQREGGSGLDGATRDSVRQATGLEVQDAQLHSGPEVDRLAQQMHARAFTQGRDVFLGSRGRDQATLTHELAHVAQGRTGPGVVQRADEDPGWLDEEGAGPLAPTVMPEEIQMPEEYVGRDAPRPADASGDGTGGTGVTDPLTATIGGEAGVSTVNEDTSPQVMAPQPTEPAVTADSGLAKTPVTEEVDEEPQRQVSMQLEGSDGKTRYVDKPKKPAPAPHERLDPRTEAIIENKKIQNDAGQMVDPLGPINRQEREEKVWDQAKWDEQHRKKKEDTSREGTAIDLIQGSAPEAPLTATPSTGGEPEASDLPTLKLNKPGKPEEKKEAEPFVPQTFSFELTIDNKKEPYKGLTAEEAIHELKVQWASVRGFIDLYKKWHGEVLKNRRDHPVVGFVVDLFSRQDPPEIEIWDGLENDLGEAMKAIDVDVAQLRRSFEESERRREEQDKAEDDKRAAEGKARLLPFRGINPKWGTQADWEKYMEGHIRRAVASLQKAAHRIQSRQKAVFYYKEKTIGTTQGIVTVLEGAKKAGAIAASFLPIGRGVGLVRSAVMSAGFSTAYGATQDVVGQGSEMVFGDRTEFDFSRIGKNALKTGVTTFVGAMSGGFMGRALGGALARRFGGKLSKEALGRIQTWLVEPLTNVASSPLTTSTRVALERAVGDRKTLSLGTLFDEIVNGLPEDAIMGFVGAGVSRNIDAGSKSYERPIEPNVARRPSPETAAPVPTGEAAPAPRPTEAPVPVAEATTAPRPAETPTPVAEATTAPRPAEAPTPVAEAPVVAGPEPAPTIAAPPTSPAPTSTGRRRGRAQPPPIPDAARRRGPTAREREVGDRRTTTRAIDENAQPTGRRTEPSDAELAVGDSRTTTRAVDESAQPTGRRTEPSDAELAVGDRRTTTRAVDENAQPTGRRTEPSDAELAVGDRRTSIRLDENGQPIRRTEPSDAELAVGDRRTTTRAVEEPMGPTYGPIEPGIKALPEFTTFQPRDPADAASAMKMYETAVTDTRGREAAIYFNPATREYIIVQGDASTAAVAPGEGPSIGKAQRWQRELESGNTGRWQLVRHSHPSEAGGFVADVNRMPSGPGGDMMVMVGESINAGGQARSSIIDYNTPNGPRRTEFGFDPKRERPFWIQPPDGAPPLSFKTLESYQNYLETTFPRDAAVVEVPPWLSGNSPVLLANQAADAARPTQQMPAQGPTQRNTGDVTTQQMPAQGTTQRMNIDPTTQQMPAQGPVRSTPDATTQQMPAQGTTQRSTPDATTQQMPAQGTTQRSTPDATTQQMPTQGTTQRSDAFATTQQMPAVGAEGGGTGGGGRGPRGDAGGGRPTGPVEVVPIQNAADARILMQDWPGDRPLRLLSNGEGRRAWNRDYGQPGDPPPAWFDPRKGLVVDADQVRPPTQERGTYHVPAENAYVMFNIESPKEVGNIYRQNEAANAVQGAQSARSLLLDHGTFVRTFEAARGWAPDPPAGFVDQNGRLYVDISRVDISSQGDVAVTGNAPPKQPAPSRPDVAGAPTARQDIAGAPTVLQGAAKPLGGDDALAATAPQDPAFAPTAPQANGGGGRPRLSDTAGGGDSLPGSSVPSAPRASDSGSQSRINPYETMRPVERIDDPVHAAQLYANFQEQPAHRRGRVRTMETADFQEAWRLSGAGQDPARPAPVAWVDSHGNLLIDFDRANLDLGGVPRGPVRRGEAIRYPEAEPYNQPAPIRGVYQPGQPRGLTREIHSFEEAQRLWTDEIMANREVRVLNTDKDVLVDLWQNTYGGKGDAPPLAWIDAQGFLVVDRTRVPMPDAVWGELSRTAPP